MTRRGWGALASVVVAIGAVGCSEPSNDDWSNDDEPGDSDEAPSVDVTGDWDTHWGSTQSDMTLSQSGADVSGSYELAAGWGTIDGTMSGRTMSGTWSDEYGSGRIELSFSADGNSFNGTWSGGNSWSGTRITDGTAPTGSYSETCNQCEIDSGRLCCYCTSQSGWESWTCLELPCGESIANCDGGLTCGECAE